MKKPGKAIIINSIIWGLVLIGCSLALRGTGSYEKIWLILASGAGFSTVLLESSDKKKKEKFEH